MSIGKFKVINIKTIYQGTKVQVDTETILLPNGNTANWDVMVYPNFYFGVTVQNNQVLMTKEWRQGPHDYLTQFTGARAPFASIPDNLNELKRELQEEMGIIRGSYKKLVKFVHGTRLTGYSTYFIVTNFELAETKRDENEIQEIIRLPVKGLYKELLKNHIATPDTLLVAKLLEEKLS